MSVADLEGIDFSLSTAFAHLYCADDSLLLASCVVLNQVPAACPMLGRIAFDHRLFPNSIRLMSMCAERVYRIYESKRFALYAYCP